MIMQRTDNKGYPGTAILIVLFFLFVCSFAKYNEKPADRAIQIEMASLIHPNSIAYNNVQQVVFQKNIIPFCISTKFNLLSVKFMLISENRITDQKIISRQKALLSINPITQHWFFNLFHQPESETPPILS
jgi:hypothetical protein